MKKTTYGYIFMLFLISFWLVGCTNDQAAPENNQLDTESISFSGENPQQQTAPENSRKDIQPQPGREQNIFTNEGYPNNNQGIRTTPPEETNQGKQADEQTKQFQEQVVQLTNKEREKQGLSALQTDNELAGVAQTKSEDMAEHNYFSHTSPTYGSPFDMLKQFGVEYTTAAENIASGQQSAQEVVTGWMNSPGHRKNILNKKVTHIGVGYAKDGAYWTQLFIAK
ncbi:hypothetical protein Pryu01_01059 [Paraliobacillus ryukyuensis]|uniref:Putative YkwD family protein n=1 Tax=Paraliobacillus ryukyuensis TaxID=200904 RepID=A0A366EG14_9BACI|nr:CAP domain-containing protein [Paraliobacillus ryukyuensis]RBP00369.1 putative YkwD family protein [Paraliobacillus ryukyuensis]